MNKQRQMLTLCEYVYSYMIDLIFLTYNCVFIGICLPASCLQEIPEELLVIGEGWRRAGAGDSLRLDETLLQTLQTPQAVSSQHA